MNVVSNIYNYFVLQLYMYSRKALLSHNWNHRRTICKLKAIFCSNPKLVSYLLGWSLCPERQKNRRIFRAIFRWNYLVVIWKWAPLNWLPPRIHTCRGSYLFWRRQGNKPCVCEADALSHKGRQGAVPLKNSEGRIAEDANYRSKKILFYMKRLLHVDAILAQLHLFPERKLFLA